MLKRQGTSSVQGKAHLESKQKHCWTIAQRVSGLLATHLTWAQTHNSFSFSDGFKIMKSCLKHKQSPIPLRPMQSGHYNICLWQVSWCIDKIWSYSIMIIFLCSSISSCKQVLISIRLYLLITLVKKEVMMQHMPKMGLRAKVSSRSLFWSSDGINPETSVILNSK